MQELHYHKTTVCPITYPAGASVEKCRNTYKYMMGSKITKLDQNSVSYEITARRNFGLKLKPPNARVADVEILCDSNIL